MVYESELAVSSVTKYQPDGRSSIVANCLAAPTGLVLDKQGRLLYREATGSILEDDIAGNSLEFASGLYGSGRWPRTAAVISLWLRRAGLQFENTLLPAT